MKTFCALFFAVCLLGVSLLPSLAWATDKLDLTVSLKTLEMLDEPIRQTAIFAIIYIPDDENSKNEANLVKSLIDADTLKIENLKVVSQLVSVNDLNKLVGTRIAFLAHGLTGKNLDDVRAAAIANKIVTLTTNIDYVKAQKCILGVMTKPDVSVFYSKAAAEAAKIGFTESFLMLVDQV
jgi:hypothetical protein